MLDEIDHFAAGLRAHFNSLGLARADEFADIARTSLTSMYRQSADALGNAIHWESIATVLRSNDTIAEKHEQIAKLTATRVVDRKKVN